MPYYKIECPHCREIDIRFLHVEDLEKFQKCEACGEESKPNVIIDECPSVHLGFPGSATHAMRRDKVDATPEYEFVPNNGKDLYPEGPEGPETKVSI